METGPALSLVFQHGYCGRGFLHNVISRRRGQLPRCGKTIGDRAGSRRCLDSHCGSFQYNRFVDTIENAMRLHLQNLEGGMTRFSSIASAEARRQNSTWPMVTIPAFEVIGESVRTQTGLEIIAFCPIVTVDDVEVWEAYSISHAQEWLEESRQASLSAAAKLQGSGQRTSSLVATDYEEGYPSAHILDLTSSVAEISAGAEMTFALSTQESPSGPYIPVW
jgi:hypothetical protein